MASPPQPRLSVHSHGLSLAAIAWRPRLGGEGSIATGLLLRPSSATARQLPRLHCYGTAASLPCRRLNGHSTTVSARRPRFDGLGMAAMAPWPRLRGHGSTATTLWHGFTATALRLHGSTTPRLGCFASTTTVDGHSSPRPVDGHGHAATATARRPRLGDHDSTTTPGR